MRIISGKYKGRHIPVRKNFPSRPTTDFAKENLFNILQNHVDFEGLKVLDLFAGTGSMGLEFASRGAAVHLVEKDYRSFSFIKETLSKLEIVDCKAYKADAFKVIKKVGKYDIIFADPPYQLEEISEIPDAIFENNILKADGWFILEHPKSFAFQKHARFSEHRTYGSVNFSFFR